MSGPLTRLRGSTTGPCCPAPGGQDVTLRTEGQGGDRRPEVPGQRALDLARPGAIQHHGTIRGRHRDQGPIGGVRHRSGTIRLGRRGRADRRGRGYQTEEDHQGRMKMVDL